MAGHDLVLDYLRTPEELIRCHSTYGKPQGIAWDEVGEKLHEVPIFRQLTKRTLL